MPPAPLSPLELARVLFTARCVSRRLGKRILYEREGKGDSAELDGVLASIRTHPQRAKIEREFCRLVIDEPMPTKPAKRDTDDSAPGD